MPESAPDRFLVVSLGSGPSAERVALPAGLVRAVAPVPALIRLPGAPPAVSGLAALRGGVVPVLDLARLLAPAAAPFPPGRLVLAEIDGPVGLLVGRVSGPTVDPGPARIIDLPAVVAGLRSGRPLGASVAGSAPRADAGAAGPPVALVALTVAGASYALPLDEVEAVASLPAPLAPDDGDGAASTVGTMALPGPLAFLGTMPWRGRALPLLSLSVLLGRGPAPGTRVAVVGGVGLVAERVGPVLRLPREAIDPVPRALRAGPAAGFARLDDGRTLVCILSARSLLSGQPGTVPVASRAESSRATSDLAEPVLALDLAGDVYGLPAGTVRAVTRAPERLVRVPRAPEGLAGMLGTRTGALPVLDLRRRLGLPPSGGACRRMVVVEAAGLRAGLLVDGAVRLLRPRADAIRTAPGDGRDAAVTRILGLGNRSLPLIDPAILLARPVPDATGRPS